MRRIAIQPVIDRAGGAVQHDAEAPERPAVVRDGHEEAGRQPVERADLASDERHFPAESHRADVEIVDARHDRRFDLGEPRVGIDVVERAKELLLRVRVARRPIAADAHADRARGTALALRVPHRVQNAFADAVQRAIRAPEMRQFHGERVLRVGVLAPAALEDQFDLDLVALPLIEVDDGRARSEVVARVLAVDRVDRVGPQLPAPSRLGHRLANLLAHPDLVGADRRLHLEGRHAGVLTDRAFAIHGQIDVLRDDVQCLGRPRADRLRHQRRLHRRAHVGRQIRRGSNDQLQHALEERRQHTGQYTDSDQWSVSQWSTGPLD